MSGDIVRWLTIAAALALISGCGPSSEIERLPYSGPIVGPFWVSEHFAPSGHMGDGQEPGHIFADINEGCLERPAGAGGDCYRFTYVPGEKLWAGVYWVHPANNWGTRPGRDVASEYSRVRFYAATSVDMGVQFIAGGIRDQDLTFKDQFKVSDFPSVTTQYQQYTLDLSLENITSIVGAFAFTLNYPPGTDPAAVPPTVIYLDDIVWE